MVADVEYDFYLVAWKCKHMKLLCRVESGKPRGIPKGRACSVCGMARGDLIDLKGEKTTPADRTLRTALLSTTR